MSKIATLLTLLVAVLACGLLTAPAQAQRDRVFVASYGSDSNPCTFGSPCKTFQQAVNVVALNGEVTAIDSAGFGPLIITQSVTITSPNGVEAGIQAIAGGLAIVINAPNANVTLRGLTLEGAGVAHNGIVFNEGASLTVIDCVVQNFHYFGSGDTSGTGILIEPSSGTISFTITNSIFVNNDLVGIVYEPTSGSTATASGLIDHVMVNNNSYGIVINTSGGGSTSVAISNSIASNNNQDGIYFNGSSISGSIDSCNISGNTNGVSAAGSPKVLLGRSVITSNSGNGLVNGTAPNSFFTYQNNQINLNGNSNTVDGSAPVALTFQ